MKNLLLLFLLSAFVPAFALDIVLPENPHKYEKMAADELFDALKNCSVPDLRITDAQSAVSPAIFLASSKKEGNNEAWQLKSTGKDLVITGTSPIGTLYGVYALLRKAGVYFIAWDAAVIRICPNGNCRSWMKDPLRLSPADRYSTVIPIYSGTTGQKRVIRNSGFTV